MSTQVQPPAPAAAAIVCPICDGSIFEPGPGGRLGSKRSLPRCKQCNSLERHRATRIVVEALRDRDRFKRSNLLEFSDSRVVPHAWFQTATAVRDAKGIDPMAIPRPDGAFDVVLSLHVLNRVADHRVAVKELRRVLAKDGFACLSFSSPLTRATSEELTGAALRPGGNRRILGRDFENELRDLMGGAYVVAVDAPDPVTTDIEAVYVVSPSFPVLRKILTADFEMRLVE